MVARILLRLWIFGLLVSGATGADGGDSLRVVSLAPNLTQIVLAIGAGENLVAVTPFCQAPSKITRLPGGIQPEAEAVLGLQPDLVLATSMTPAATRRQLQDLGIRVEVIDANSLEAIRNGITRMAALMETPPPTTAVHLPVPATRSAALLFGAGTGYSAGCGTHAHEILEAAGLRNIAAASGGPWPQLGEEFLLAADPDVLVIADYANADRNTILDILRRHPVRKHLTAVRTGRVVIFPAPVFSVPGPAALEAADALRTEVEKL